MSELEAVDWSTGAAVAVVMAVDPARRAKEQIDAVFARARRLRQGAAISHARLADAVKALAGLSALEGELARAEEVDLPVIEGRARAAAPREFKVESAAAPPGKTARNPQARPPHRTFLGASGARILVGRAAAHNDALTFHVARPHDLWLHAKGHAGAHVVVPLDKTTACPPDVLVEAAHLAAHFSEARDEDIVEVQYVQRRYVRKPRGSAPGLVVVDREKVIVLRRQPEILRRLLQAEQP